MSTINISDTPLGWFRRRAELELSRGGEGVNGPLPSGERSEGLYTRGAEPPCFGSLHECRFPEQCMRQGCQFSPPQAGTRLFTGTSDTGS